MKVTSQRKRGKYGTPLRYPGGKQKLSPFIDEIITANSMEGCHYAEPYAGGAGVAINLLLSDRVSHIHLNDACVGIYSFWHCVLHETESFCQRISDAPLTVEEWRHQKEILARPSEFTISDVGFSLFYLNRVNRSGIVAGGGLIGGVKQDGKWRMDARFSKKELIRRIVAIGAKRNAISIYNEDAEAFIGDVIPSLPENLLIYCDPPYFLKADRLYWNHYKQEDHPRIAQLIQSMARQWIVSYDTAAEIFASFSGRRSFVYKLQYNADKAYKGDEVFFFSDDIRLPDSSAISSINTALQMHHAIE